MVGIIAIGEWQMLVAIGGWWALIAIGGGSSSPFGGGGGGFCSRFVDGGCWPSWMVVVVLVTIGRW